MANKKRLGSDAFDWLKDTRGAKQEGGGNQIKQLSDVGSGQSSIGQDGARQSGIAQGGLPSNDVKQRATQSVGKQGKAVGKQAAGKTSKQGLPQNWTRATFIVREDLLKKMKDLAYWDRKAVKDLFEEILQKYIDHRHRKDGEVQPRPKKNR